MAQSGSKEEPYKGLRGWAKHVVGSKEFSLLLVGAALTGFLLPNLLETSQNYQKELEVKTNLVKQITETTSRPLTLVQALEGLRRGDNSSEFANDTKRTLTTERLDVLRTGSILKSQFETYFPGTDIPVKWQNLSTATHNFIKLSQFPDPNTRKFLAESVYEYLLGQAGVGKFEVVKDNIDRISDYSSPDYADGYNYLYNLLTTKQDELIKKINDYKIPAYENILERFSSFFRR